MHADKGRLRLVEQARRYLETAGRPRLAMLGVLSVTLAAGFLASVAMVHLGVDRMSVRYPLAVAVAYTTFLVLLRGWLGRQDFAVQLSEDPEGLLLPGVAALGAAAIAGEQAAMGPAPASDDSARRHGGNGVGGNLDGLLDIGDGLGAPAILVLIAGLCTAIVSIDLVVTSPLLLAELLVDGALLGALSRAAADPPPHRSRSIVRRTWIAALVTAVVFGLVGWGIERVAPGARTLAEAWRIDRSR